MQRELGVLTFSELTAASRPDAETALRGATASTTVGPKKAAVGLYYGQLTRGEAAGTRVLVKAYSSEANNQLTAELVAAAAESSEDMQAMRERLEAAIGTTGGADSTSPPGAALPGGGGDGDGGSGGDNSARLSLEASLDSDGTSLAEALALNEWAAHSRVQGTLAARGVSFDDVEKRGLSRLIGRSIPEAAAGEPALILHVFPWRGEQVRMALPTKLPPTLGGWAEQRRRGETEGQKLWDGSVPRRAAQARSRFVRSALRGALVGLGSLHAAGLVHQSLSPSAILLSTDDDRKSEAGNSLKSWLTELSFCRDARSLCLAYRTGPEGEQLPIYDDVLDPLELGLAQRTLRRTVRPGDLEERAAFARADEMREFGLLMLESFVLFNAPPGAEAVLSPLRLRSLIDATFTLADEDGFTSDGVDIAGLRAYLDAEDGLRVGEVGGVEMLSKIGKTTTTSPAEVGTSGWDLIQWMMRPDWKERPTVDEALAHPFWEAPMFF